MLPLNKDHESWRRVSVEAVMSGSQAQAENVLRMAIEDILRLEAPVSDIYRLAYDRGRADVLAESSLHHNLSIPSGERWASLGLSWSGCSEMSKADAAAPRDLSEEKDSAL